MRGAKRLSHTVPTPQDAAIAEIPDDGLSPLQRAFVNEFILDRNGTAAAIRAGYAESGARTQAVRLLANANIATAIAHLERESMARIRVSADDVKAETAAIAFSDITNVVTWDSDLGIPRMLVADARDLPRHVRAAIQHVKIKRGQYGYEWDIKMHAKQPALDKLAEFTGLTGPDGAVTVNVQNNLYASLTDEQLDAALDELARSRGYVRVEGE